MISPTHPINALFLNLISEPIIFLLKRYVFYLLRCHINQLLMIYKRKRPFLPFKLSFLWILWNFLVNIIHQLNFFHFIHLISSIYKIFNRTLIRILILIYLQTYFNVIPKNFKRCIFWVDFVTTWACYISL